MPRGGVWPGVAIVAWPCPGTGSLVLVDAAVWICLTLVGLPPGGESLDLVDVLELLSLLLGDSTRGVSADPTGSPRTPKSSLRGFPGVGFVPGFVFPPPKARPMVFCATALRAFLGLLDPRLEPGDEAVLCAPPGGAAPPSADPTGSPRTHHCLGMMSVMVHRCPWVENYTVSIYCPNCYSFGANE